MMLLTIAAALARAPLLSSISDTPRLDIELLLTHILDKPRTYLFTWPERELSVEQTAHFNALFQRREQGEPIAHIIGVREFWSLPLRVNSSTLIPRPDTETLVEAALDCARQWSDSAEPMTGLDLGTGTGAIALALASELPSWQWIGVDQSNEAVALAQQNQQDLGFTNVQFLQSDWYAAVAGKQFTLIVSNPPYIDPADPHLTQGDVRFEPLRALIAENHGLADLQHIIEHAPTHLVRGGWLLLEHGYDQALAVRTLLTARGFDEISSKRDFGGNDRVTQGRWMSEEISHA